jgi:hypothetical protein
VTFLKVSVKDLSQKFKKHSDVVSKKN